MLLQVDINHFLPPCHSFCNTYNGMGTNWPICSLNGISWLLIISVAPMTRSCVACALNSLSEDGISFPSANSDNIEALIQDYFNESPSEQSMMKNVVRNFHRFSVILRAINRCCCCLLQWRKRWSGYRRNWRLTTKHFLLTYIITYILIT